MPLYAYKEFEPDIHDSVFCAPSADIIGHVSIGKESSVWFNAVIRGDEPDHPIQIGSRTSIQDGSIIHVNVRHATRIGNDVTIGHGAILEGCTVEDGALIGMNAVVLPGVTIGERALVAAGCVVPEGMTVEPETLVAGVPAKPRKKLEGTSLNWIKRSPDHYVQLSRTYLTDLRSL